MYGLKPILIIMSQDTNIKGFIQAVKNDEYAELKLSENVYLITDTEFDGTFLPYVIDSTEKYTEDEIHDMMENAGVSKIFTWYDMDYDESDHTFYPIVESCEYENIDYSVWE